MKTMFPASIDGMAASNNPIYAFDERRGLYYFSLRDLGQFKKDWLLQGNAHSTEVEQLAVKISKCIYEYGNIYALNWKPGYLYIIDNKKNFHARTEQSHKTSRHLKRIRVL
jgi:hypothetical protein